MNDHSTTKLYVCGTRLGWIAVALTPFGIRACSMPHNTREEALDELGAPNQLPMATVEELGDLPQQLRYYAEGVPTVFDSAVDLTWATPFQRTVLNELRNVPYGQTRSYGWLAEMAGSPGAVRAVGQVMASNPVPVIVPCHRIVRSDGSLGGYGAGLETKAQLLRLEGLRVTNLENRWLLVETSAGSAVPSVPASLATAATPLR